MEIFGNGFTLKETLPTPEPTMLPTPAPVVNEPEASSGGEASDEAKTTDEAKTSDDKAGDKADDEAETAVDLDKISVLVVNATGIAGYAGELKSELESGGVGTIKAGNAAGDYPDSGVFVMMADKDTELIDALEEAGGKKLTYDEDYQVEDEKGTYDAVIVLNDK